MRDPLAEPRTTPVRLVTCHDPAAEAAARATLPTEYFIAATQVNETTWRRIHEHLNDNSHDDFAYVVPGSVLHGMPIRHYILPPLGVDITIQITADGETWDVGSTP